MFRRRPTVMNNERYSRVHKDERELFELEEQELNQNQSWAQKKSFQPLASEEQEDDDLTNPMSNLPRSASPASGGYLSPMIKSPATSIHGASGSFDLDESEDEDLKRYKLDFTDHSNERRVVSVEETLTRGGRLSFSAVQHAFLIVQMDTRRKRVERLLSVNTETEKLQIQIASWCDIYDRGLTILVLATVVWIVMCLLLHKTFLLVVGILFFLTRLSAKPTYWYIFGRHISRKRKATMDIYDELNHIATNTDSMSTQEEDEEERTGSRSLEIT